MHNGRIFKVALGQVGRQAMQQRASAYFAGDGRQQRGCGALEKLRKRAATAASAGEVTLTEMEKQVVAIRAQHSDMLLLFECGYRMRIFADDAEVRTYVWQCFVAAMRLQRTVCVHRLRQLC